MIYQVPGEGIDLKTIACQWFISHLTWSDD